MSLKFVAILVSLSLPLVGVSDTITGNVIKQDPDVSLDPGFCVSLEFLINHNDQTNNPLMIKSFMDAVTEWSRHVPIRATFYFEEETPLIWFIGGAAAPEKRPGVIKVVIADLQAIPYRAEEDIIGMWEFTQNRLLFDIDYFRDNPDKAYTVALHEIGHMLGVPHFVNFKELALTGYVVVPANDIAQNYIMYPVINSKSPQTQLSATEIRIALHQVWYLITCPDGRIIGKNCKFRVDKSQKQ